MNIERIKYFSRVISGDIWNITGEYFSGMKEKDSKWYQGFSRLPLEIRIYSDE